MLPTNAIEPGSSSRWALLPTQLPRLIVVLIVTAAFIAWITEPKLLSEVADALDEPTTQGCPRFQYGATEVHGDILLDELKTILTTFVEPRMDDDDYDYIVSVKSYTCTKDPMGSVEVSWCWGCPPFSTRMEEHGVSLQREGRGWCVASEWSIIQ